MKRNRREGREERRKGESNKLTEKTQGANPEEKLLCHNCALKQHLKEEEDEIMLYYRPSKFWNIEPYL